MIASSPPLSPTASEFAGRIPVFDAHQHVWDIEAHYHPWLCDEPAPRLRYGDYTSLRRNYMPDDYRRDFVGFDLRGCVHVEAEWNPADPVGESRWIHEVAREHGLPTVMVAQARLNRDDVADVLAAQAAFPLVRGVRHKPTTARSPAELQYRAPGSMSDPVWRAGYATLARHKLSFDLQAPWWHLPEAAELASDHPETTLIIDHAAMPDDRTPEGLAGWRRAVEIAARQPNVTIKISGLGHFPGVWPTEQNIALIRAMIDAFGAARCMVASNYPVDRLVATLSHIYGAFLEATDMYGEAVQRALFHDNARRIYRVDDATL